jgi:outer membrane protein insertion porin family
MTPSLDLLRYDRLAWLGLSLLLVAPGCARLAPGIAPIPSDPPSTAFLGSGVADTLFASEQETITAYDDIELQSLQQGELIPAKSEDSGLYVARQYPRTYAAPPPPNMYPGPQPPSVYQVPPGYQAPPSYQPPQNLPVPPGGVPVAPSQPLPPPLTPPAATQFPAPYGTPGGVLTPPVGDFGYGDPLLGSSIDPYAGTASAPPVYIPNTRTADLEITGYPARTGRIMFGGAVNSDAGVTGQVTIDERNFDIMRFPRSFRDLASGTAFRGAGQTLRLEAVPGSVFKRYTASFADPNLFGYLPISFGLSGFLYDRRFQDYDEERLGGRISFGYRVTPDLSISTGVNGQNVEVSNVRGAGAPSINPFIGDTDLFSGEVRLTHDTRNSPFQPSEGHFFEFSYEKAFGEVDYSRFDVENRNYLLISERADGSGRQTLSLTTRLGFSGEETPFFENYYAGGYSTMRGFDFRGASPTETGVNPANGIYQVGGRFQFLNSLEYMFPITADDAFRGVAFVDFGTVEKDIEIDADNFRVAPGVGLRISIPMLGPAPLAFDFAYPVAMADTDERRVFSFYMSTTR